MSPKKLIHFHNHIFPVLLIATFLLHGCASIYEPLPDRRRPSYPQPSYPAPAYPQQEKPTPAQPPSTPDTPPQPSLPSPPSTYDAPTGAASSLYKQTQQYISQGQYRKAELTLERALRIEPKNGYYWYTMADLKYRQNKPSQAVQFCLKSKSLAGKDKKLIRLNDNLIRLAQ